MPQRLNAALELNMTLSRFLAGSSTGMCLFVIVSVFVESALESEGLGIASGVGLGLLGWIGCDILLYERSTVIPRINYTFRRILISGIIGYAAAFGFIILCCLLILGVAPRSVEASLLLALWASPLAAPAIIILGCAFSTRRGEF